MLAEQPVPVDRLEPDRPTELQDDERLEVVGEANDAVVPAGHQLGLVISGSRNGALAVDTAATPYTVNLAGSQLNLPVAGPMAGFGPGHLTAKDTEDLSPGTSADLNMTMWPAS